MIEFFTIEKTLALAFFLFCAIYFFYATEKKKKEIWSAIKGDDNKLQVTEIATLYWCRLFPILFFVNLSIVILGLSVTPEHVELITKAWYSMDAMFGFVMMGHGISNYNKPKK